jgi:hypothetical protein
MKMKLQHTDKLSYITISLSIILAEKDGLFASVAIAGKAQSFLAWNGLQKKIKMIIQGKK